MNEIVHQHIIDSHPTLDEIVPPPAESPLRDLLRRGFGQDAGASLAALWRLARLQEQPVELAAFDCGRWSTERYIELKGHAVAYAATPAQAAALADAPVHATGYYCRPCGVTPSALARYPHDEQWHVAKAGSIKETEVTSARVLAIDIDPERASGVNSSTAEMQGALRIAWAIRDSLLAAGIPESALAMGMSGNGAHLLLALDCPWNGIVKEARTDLLRVLAALYDQPGYKIDPSLADGSQLLPLYGSWKRKGPNVEDRKQRKSWLVAGDLVTPLDLTELQMLAAALKNGMSDAQEEVYASSSQRKGAVQPMSSKSGDDTLAKCGEVSVMAVAQALGIDTTNPTCPSCGKGNESNSSQVTLIPRDNPRVLKCLHGSCGVSLGAIELVRVVNTIGELRGSKENVEKVIEWFVENNFVEAPPKRGRPHKSYNSSELGYSEADLERMGVWFEERDTVPESKFEERRPRTDAGNAERLIDMFGESVCYVPDWKRWHCWNGSIWVGDPEGVAMNPRAVLMARAIPQEADGLAPAEQGAIKRYAKESEQSGRLTAAIHVARGLAVASPADFDSDPWVLNCQNGIVDLKTGALRDHDPAAKCTKVVGVSYDPDADTTLIDRVLARVQPDPEVRAYLWRLLGYSITGVVREHVFPIHHGKAGRNGKSTVLNAVSNMLDKYATILPKSVVIETRSQEHPTNIAKLKGTRFAIISEIRAGDKLNVSQVKELTGGDTLTARGMNQDFYDFRPTHHIHMFLNDPPVIQSIKDPIWKRVHLIPWNVTIPEAEQELDLLGKLEVDPGLLRRLVEGAVAYAASGLQTPDSVVAATTAYRREENVLQDFVDARLDLAPSDVDPTSEEWTVRTNSIYIAYEAWARAQGNQHPWKIKRLVKELDDQQIGTAGRNAKRQSLRHGVRVADDDDLTTCIPTEDATYAPDDDESLLFEDVCLP